MINLENASATSIRANLLFCRDASGKIKDLAWSGGPNDPRVYKQWIGRGDTIISASKEQVSDYIELLLRNEHFGVLVNEDQLNAIFCKKNDLNELCSSFEIAIQLFRRQTACAQLSGNYSPGRSFQEKL